MHLWALLLAFLKANQFASGGMALAAIATLWAMVRPVPVCVWRRLTNLAYVYIDVPNSDPLYGCMMRWLANHPRARRFRWVSAGTSPDTGAISGQAPVAIGDEVKSEVFFFPAPGTHFLTHRGRPIWVWRERDGQAQTHSSIWKEILHVKVFCRDPKTARALVEEAFEAANPPSNEIRIYKSVADYWGQPLRVVPRSTDSVLLPGAELEELLSDCQRFLASEEWYRRVGVPWRRGYLFEGAPGTGKSSTALALAGALGRNLRCLTLFVSDGSFQSLLGAVQPNDILLIEDVDAVSLARDSEGSFNHVTLGTLLNAIDGVGAGEGRLVFMTTNRPEVLDTALLRPGRMDVRVRFENATPEQATRLYQRFFPRESAAVALEFGLKAANGERSMADVQGELLLRRANTPERPPIPDVRNEDPRYWGTRI